MTDIFPAGHPLRQALRLEGDELRETAAETELQTASGMRRVGVSVQGIQENGEQMGALVTLRDLDSLESINTQLQVSERLAALGRITAGVAHEVKNPLNSMRLWLENLKESLPPDQDAGAQQAVQVLDKEIDRLDAVVKRFLDFTRPVELKLEATNLAELLRDVVQRRASATAKSRSGSGRDCWATACRKFGLTATLLKQAVLNLVLNAVEAMPAGGELRVELTRRGEMAEISVSDTGKGIAAGKSAKNFPAVLHHAAGRQRYRTCDNISYRSATQWFDRFSIGSWARHDISHRIAAGRMKRIGTTLDSRTGQASLIGLDHVGARSYCSSR